MADSFKWPELPSGWRYGSEAEAAGAPPPESLPPEQNIGSLLRSVAGPSKPDEPVSFLNSFLEPTVKKVAETVIPHTPAEIGTAVASLIVAGPGGPLARMAGKVAPEAVGALGAIGRTGIQRIIGTGLGGAVGAAAGGDNPATGAVAGALTQLGGEGIAKLTQWGRANAQMRDLATTDPEKLGEIVSNIIPGIGSMKSPKDFHAAFKKGAAQQAISQAYRQGLDDVNQQLQGELIPSGVMTQIRSAVPTAGRNPLLSGFPAPAKYSFDDITETIRRLRDVGWNKDEIARGVGARDARQAADALEKDLLNGLPPPLAEQFTKVNGDYARGARVTSFFDDPKLFKDNGDLNIPALQKKIKADGYSTGQSYQMAADAADLEAGLFRGTGGLGEDMAGTPGSFLPRLHSGGFSIFPKLPVLAKYAGTEPYGLSAFGGSQIGQMLRRGVGGNRERPISLAAPDEKP